MSATVSDIRRVLARADVGVRLRDLGPAKPSWQWQRDLPRWAHDVPRGYVRMGCVFVEGSAYMVAVLAHRDDEGEFWPEGIVEVLSEDEHETTGDILSRWTEPRRAAVVEVFMRSRWEVSESP